MDRDDDLAWYFAYGSNLCLERMARRTGPIRQGDDRPRRAHLPDHRLSFNMHGEDGQVYANIVRPGEGVYGVVYRCDRAALEKLDVYEQGYERIRVLVTLEDGETREAFVYVAKPDRVLDGRYPSAAYLDTVLRGARQHQLPEAYVHGIESRCEQDS